MVQKPSFWRECERVRGKKKEKKGWGVIYRDRLSGKASGVRGEDLLFMLETGQG